MREANSRTRSSLIAINCTMAEKGQLCGMGRQITYPRGWAALAALLLLFGLLTLAASSAVLFNLGNAKAEAGRAVPLVLWMNFVASFLYLVAGGGLIARRRWTLVVLLLAVVLLLVAAAGFALHVRQGLPYEPRTFGALAIRIVVTLLLYAAAQYFFKRGIANAPNHEHSRT